MIYMELLAQLFWRKKNTINKRFQALSMSTRDPEDVAWFIKTYFNFYLSANEKRILSNSNTWWEAKEGKSSLANV